MSRTTYGLKGDQVLGWKGPRLKEDVTDRFHEQTPWAGLVMARRTWAHKRGLNPLRPAPTPYVDTRGVKLIIKMCPWVSVCGHLCFSTPPWSLSYATLWFYCFLCFCTTLVQYHPHTLGSCSYPAIYFYFCSFAPHPFRSHTPTIKSTSSALCWPLGGAEIDYKHVSLGVRGVPLVFFQALPWSFSYAALSVCVSFFAAPHFFHLSTPPTHPPLGAPPTQQSASIVFVFRTNHFPTPPTKPLDSLPHSTIFLWLFVFEPHPCPFYTHTPCVVAFTQLCVYSLFVFVECFCYCTTWENVQRCMSRKNNIVIASLL